jgi:prolyl 4-hydroxylase
MQNYTEVGYKKMKAPEELFSMISDFWEKNKAKAKQEQWGVGNTYTNNWDVPSDMVSVEDSGLRGGGYALKQRIWDAAKIVIGEWTGQELTQCSLYGIRIYKEGAVLSPHVDRLPLVSSAIINVAQDVDEPWPLEVIGHDGKAANVTMEPGDMVLYESHSVIHGRPFPLKGRFMANIFIHFEPNGHSLRHNFDAEHGKDGDVHAKYKDSLARGVGGHESDNAGLPPYIIPGTPEENHWKQTHPSGAKTQEKKTFGTGSTLAHEAAKVGDAKNLEAEIKKKKHLVNAKDENGWTPLHEGARGGHLEVVKLLIDHGADKDAQTFGVGGSPLWWAKKSHPANHPVVTFLESIGASMIGPEL